MTTQKRIRIFEIIVGIILIVLSIYSLKTNLRAYFPFSDHISWNEIKEFFSMKYSWLATINLVAMLLQTVVGLMLITRKYNKLWLKIPFGITAVSTVLSSYIVWLIVGKLCGDVDTSDFSRYFDKPEFICFILAPLINIMSIVVAFLTINKKIVWKTRKALLIYSLAGITASIILSAISYLAAISTIFFLIPCFIQPYASKRSIKGIIGEIAMLFSTLSYPIIRWLINKIYDSENETFYNFFFGPNPAIDLRHFDVQSFLQWAARLIALLIPLLLYERQVGELKEEKASEHISVIKKLDAVLFKDNDDEEDDEEYEYEEDTDDDEEESNDSDD